MAYIKTRGYRSRMKHATLIVRQSEINETFPNGLQLVLEDNASVFDAIRAFDKEISKKVGEFPVRRWKSLLHMVYHQYEGRFYKQVAIQAYTPSTSFLNMRENPRKPLPNDATRVLIPEGGCTTDWEEPAE
jgi:hypothetical protein